MICPTGEAKYFCKGDSTHLSTNRPTGKSLEPILLSALSVSLVSRMEINPSFPDVQLHIVGAPLGASPESITTTGSMDSGLAQERAPE
jgi:hypothetical protein